MEITHQTVTTLHPSEGMWLTDGNVATDGPVWLGINDTPDRWRECDAAEAAAINNPPQPDASDTEGEGEA